MTTQPDTGWTGRLLTGLAEHLAAAGISTWRPTGIYNATETGTTLLVTPGTPDRIVTLTPYDVTTNPGLSDRVQGIQVRVRAGRNPLDALDLTDRIYHDLDGRTDLTLSGIPVALIWRQSQLPLGPDGNGRHEITANYYARLAHPSATVTD